jgi:thioredoxin-like negative regulator of GroEL
LPRAEQGYRALLLLLHGRSDASTPYFRSAVYVELAAIKLKLGDPEAAQELVESGFEMALGNVRELSALVQALTAHQQWDAAERATLALLELGQDLQSSASALRCVKELAMQPRALSPRLLEQAQHIAEQARARYRELDEPAERSTLLAACVSLLPLPEARELLAEGEQELAAADATQARLALARRLLDAGSESERTEALAQLQALTSHPDAPAAAWQLLTQALEQAGDQAALRAVLEGWLEREPQDVALLERTLGAAVTAEDGERSLFLYDRLLQLGAALSPEQASALRQLCLKAGHTARAVELLRAEAAREPKPVKRASLLLEAAGLLLAADNTADARDVAQEARTLDPTSADAVWTLAQLALAAGQRDEALTLLSAHLESKERRRGKPLGRVLRLAADLHLERDQLTEALQLLVEAHQLDKTDLDTALLLGLLAIDLDRLETAASALRVLIAQRELGTREGAAARALNLAEGYFQLARIEQHHGKKTNAKRMALRALEENPALAKAQTLLNELALH